MGKEILKKFGRYFLLDHIAQGGMAEIYRARFASMDGSGRFLIIKRVQSGYGANAEFLQMFRSETKVMLGFNHPNIVQLYDFGEEQKQPYIAMEFVDGRNLRQIISRTIEKKISLPVELAAFIVEQAAAGLHYAHNFKDRISGNALNLIHRDVSPQNILISYEGAIKVIDFGIAKATINSEATRAGVIKGKPSYLSPEQITGETLDGRSDIFSLGAVLWELLAGKKLFAGENDLAILKMIEGCQTYVQPPSTVNPKVPKELDQIVLRCLTKQREKRFQSGDELQRSLRKFTHTHAPEFNPNDLSHFLKDLFKEEIVEDRKRLQQLNQSAEQILVLDAKAGTMVLSEDGEGESGEAEEKTMAARSGQGATGAREIEDTSGASGISIGGAGASVPSIARDFQPRQGTVSSTLPREAPAPVKLTPRVVVPKQQSSQVERGGFPLKPILIGLVILVGAVLYLPELGIKLPFQLPFKTSEQSAAQAASATLVVEGEWKDAEVFLNGRTVGKGLPLTVKKIPAPKTYKLLVKGPSEPFEKEISLVAGENKVITVGSIAKEQAKMPVVAGNGILLHLNIFPNGNSGTIHLNGKVVDVASPHVSVQPDSPLELVIERPGYAPFRREFVISSQELGAQKEQNMDIQLSPLSAGRLNLRSTPTAEVTIMIDGKPWVKKTPIQDEVLPSGRYRAVLRNVVLGMKKEVNLNIEQDRVLSLDVRLEIE